MRLPWRSSALAALVLTLGGCAPSPRILYQGNAAFEYCYAADLNPDVSPSQREACWHAWLAHYTRHQDSDRVDYALRRVEALQMGDLASPVARTVTSGGDESTADPASLAFGVGERGDPIRSRNSMQPFAPDSDDSVKTGCKVTCQQFNVACVHDCHPDFEPCLENCAAEERICLGGCY